MSLTSLPDLNRDAVLRLLPVGSIIAWWGTTPPDGFLLCNGAVLSAIEYRRLSSVRGNTTPTLTLPNIADLATGTVKYIIKY